MKKQVVLFVVLVISAFQWVSAADSLHGANDIDLLKAACPRAWEKIDTVITPKPTSVPWYSVTDRNKHTEFQLNFSLHQTKTGSRGVDTVSNDVITVLSECLKRHNLVVNAEFNKQIGNVPELKEKGEIAELLLLLFLNK